jgi:hypothetical protein
MSNQKTVSLRFRIKSNRKPWLGAGGYFFFMINTINVANAIANDNASYVVIKPPPFG